MAVYGLTSEQEVLIPKYRQKWESFILPPKPIDRYEAAAAVRVIYAILGFKTPEIVFVASPNGAIRYLRNLLDQGCFSNLGKNITLSDWCYPYTELQERIFVSLPIHLQHNLSQSFDSWLNYKLGRPLQSFLENQWRYLISPRLGKDNNNFLRSVFSSCRQPESLIAGGSYFDFCANQLNLPDFKEEVSILQSFVTSCGWTFFFEKICIVSDRPLVISFDEDNLLHGESKAAVKYPDGYPVFATHGKIQQTKHRQKSDHKDELRMLEELKAVKVDAWGEYTLFKVGDKVNVISTYLLKSINPRTGKIKVRPIPSRFTNSIQEAINWVDRKEKI
jgi:hypothetical protein